MQKKNWLVAVGVFAALAFGEAFAVSIQNVTLRTPGQAMPNTDLNSDHIVWVSDGTYPYPPLAGGILPYSPVIPAPATNSGRKAPSYDPYLVGNSGAVGSNIELSTLDGGIGSADYISWINGTSRTTLTGDHGVGTPQVVLSSLTLADWSANSLALAKEYLTGFVVDTLGLPLTPLQLDAAAYVFVTGDTGGTPAPEMLSPAYILSDPNINYVNLEGGVLKIGIAGIYDAKSYLAGFASAIGIILPDPTQLSEAVKVTYKGKTQYAYGFSATESGQSICFPGQTDPLECSDSGNTEVPIPEPASLALMSMGILGLGFGRRLAAR